MAAPKDASVASAPLAASAALESFREQLVEEWHAKWSSEPGRSQFDKADLRDLLTRMAERTAFELLWELANW
jgi:hypothetical protein